MKSALTTASFDLLKKNSMERPRKDRLPFCAVRWRRLRDNSRTSVNRLRQQVEDFKQQLNEGKAERDAFGR